MHGFSSARIIAEDSEDVVSPQLMTSSAGSTDKDRVEEIRRAKNEETTKRQREDQKSEEIWDEAIEEAQIAKIKKAPMLPTEREIDEHCATHVPFRDWCEFCVHGKARDDPHYRQRKDREMMIPEIYIDYMWLKGKFPFVDHDE